MIRFCLATLSDARINVVPEVFLRALAARGACPWDSLACTCGGGGAVARASKRVCALWNTTRATTTTTTTSRLSSWQEQRASERARNREWRWRRRRCHSINQYSESLLTAAAASPRFIATPPPQTNSTWVELDRAKANVSDGRM